MEAWDGLGVPDLVLAALQDQGFTAPTPIQTLTIPHAIRDRLDIIGAAETVSFSLLTFKLENFVFWHPKLVALIFIS